MRRSSIALIAGFLPLFLGFTPVAHAEVGDGASLFGIDVIGPDTVDPETGTRIAHLKVQVGAERYIDAEGLARAYGTDITSIREHNLGTTLARCRQSDGTLVRRTRHLKEPPPVTQDDVFALRSANGLWANCANDSKQQTLVLIQGEKLDVPRAPTAVPIKDRLNIYNNLGKCHTAECASELARNAGAKIPQADNTEEALASERKAREQREAAVNEANKASLAKVGQLNEKLKAANAKLAVYEAPKPPYPFWKVALWGVLLMGLMALGRSAWRYYKTLEDRIRRSLEKEHHAELHEKQMAIEAYLVEIGTLKGSLQTANDEAKKQEGLVSKRNTEISGLKRDLQTVIDKADGFERVIGEHDETIRQLTAQTGRDAKEIVDRGRQIAALNAENASLTATIGTSGAALWRTREANVDLQQTVTDQAAALETGRRFLEERRAENETLAASVTEWRGKALEAAEEVERLRTENAAQAAAILEGQAKIEELLQEVGRMAAAHAEALRESDEKTQQMLQDAIDMAAGLDLIDDMFGLFGELVNDKDREIAHLTELVETPDITAEEVEIPPVSEVRADSHLAAMVTLISVPYTTVMGKEFPVLGASTEMDLAEAMDQFNNRLKRILNGSVNSELLHLQGEIGIAMNALGEAIEGKRDFQCSIIARLHELTDRARTLRAKSDPPPPMPNYEDGEPDLPLVTPDTVVQSVQQLVSAEPFAPAASARPVRRETPVGLGTVVRQGQDPDRVAAFKALTAAATYLRRNVGTQVEDMSELNPILDMAWVAQHYRFHIRGREPFTLASVGSPEYQQDLRAALSA